MMATTTRATAVTTGRHNGKILDDKEMVRSCNEEHGCEHVCVCVRVCVLYSLMWLVRHTPCSKQIHASNTIHTSVGVNI